MELVNDSGKVVIRSLQDMSERANTALGDDAKDIRLAVPPAELHIIPKIEPVHTPSIVLKAQESKLWTQEATV